ncbi:MAG: hypothetical protein JSW11_07990 [Candidatus Heimdallarchaeota archaeon]|nr:MAG: hypothetical protein JSW11_07990 [Candidatus Heimdallarchaeota archaeon]
MLRLMMTHTPHSGLSRKMKFATKVLEDESTLFVRQILDDSKMDGPWGAIAELVSIFALQPQKDLKNAARTLSLVNNQEGVTVVREIFSARPVKSKTKDKEDSHTALLLLVVVKVCFVIKSESLLPALITHARKQFVQRRSMTHTMLEGSGCKVSLVTGNKIEGAYVHKERIPKGITLFKGRKGFHSQLVDLFLTLDRVPSRHIHQFSVPNLPVVHRLGTRVDNPVIPVGFPNLQTGSVLVCGSSNHEVLSVLQQLTASLTTSNQQIFVIDAHSELNGLIQHLQAHPPQALPLQMFRLGTNIHLNLCDVILPIPSTGDKENAKARAAWKSHLISQILLSSLNTSEYLTARYSVPLEAQIKKTAENHSSFTLKEVSLSIGGSSGDEVQVNTEGIDMMFADMMAIEALAGILEQFRSFPEVNYASFQGHYSGTLVCDQTITFFQFGAQPPLIRRATIGFLLHYLSQIMTRGCVVLTHAAEFLSRKTAYRRQRELVPSSTVEACNTIAQDNLLILGSQSLQALAMNMDTFEEIRNRIYLKLANAQDRELVLTSHEIAFTSRSPIHTQQQFIGIVEGEGLLFREDCPQNLAYHLKLDPSYPVDLTPIKLLETRQRGAETLGLPPPRYELLMRFLKLLMFQPRQQDEIMGLVGENNQKALALDQFKTLGLCGTTMEGGATYWVITEAGRKYYRKQFENLSLLPTPLTPEETTIIEEQLTRLENFFDTGASYQSRQETNTRIKNLVGGFLNYVRLLRGNSIPWARVAEFQDIYAIETLEWQDFRQLFDSAHALVHNLFLDLRHLQQAESTEGLQQALQATVIPPSGKHKNLEDFLPDTNLVRLQQLCHELGLSPYPETGILDLYFVLHAQNRSLFDELKPPEVKEEQT